MGRRSNADIHTIVEELEAARNNPTTLKKLQTEKGINYVPTGMLFDRNLRDQYLPIEHTIKDWQHIFLQDGVANTAIGEIMHILKILFLIKLKPSPE